jgi:hypothetical protein
VRDVVASMVCGVDHLLPSNSLTDPLRSTATQNVDVGHDTALTPPLALESVVPLVHLRGAMLAEEVAPAADPTIPPHSPPRETAATNARATRSPHP